MKFVSKFVLPLLIFSFFSCQLNGQIFDRISRSIDKAIDTEVGKMSDKVAEKMFEKLFEKLFSGEETNTDSIVQYQADSASVSSNSSNIDLSSIFNTKPTKVDKSFAFDYKLKMSVGNGEKTNVYDYYLPQSGTYSAMEINDIVVIMDLDSGDSYTIVNGNLTSFNMSKMVEKYMVKTPDDNEEVTVKKTGRKEKIAGYLCEEYIISSQDSETEVWISYDFINNDYRTAAFLNMIKEKSKSPIENAGFAFKIISKDKKNNTDSIIEVTSVTPETKLYNLADY